MVLEKKRTQKVKKMGKEEIIIAMIDEILEITKKRFPFHYPFVMFSLKKIKHASELGEFFSLVVAAKKNEDIDDAIRKYLKNDCD